MADWHSGNNIASGVGDLQVWGLISESIKSDAVLSTARLHCDISSQFEAELPRC